MSIDIKEIQEGAAEARETVADGLNLPGGSGAPERFGDPNGSGVLAGSRRRRYSSRGTPASSQAP